MPPPPPSEAERAALAGLADALPGQLEPERRWRLSLRGGAAMAVGLAATAMLVVLAHPLVTRRPSHGSVPASSQPRSDSWNAPDPDELWEASDLEFEEVDAAEAAADELGEPAAEADAPRLDPRPRRDARPLGRPGAQASRADREDGDSALPQEAAPHV